MKFRVRFLHPKFTHAQLRDELAECGETGWCLGFRVFIGAALVCYY